MKKRIMCNKTLGVLALLLIGFAGSALADKFDVNMAFGNTVVDGATWNGPEDVYVSPYLATNQDTTPTPTQIIIYCLDWNHNINFGQAWTADFLSLDPKNPDASDLYYYGATSAYQLGQSSSGTDTLSQVSVGTTEMYNRYLEAAWLFTQIQNLNLSLPANQTAANKQAQVELNVAAWTLFLDANPPVGSGTDATAFAGDINNTGGSAFANDVYNDLQCAQQHVQGASTACNNYTGVADFAGAGWYAVTPDPKTGANLTQEFLTYEPSFLPNNDPVPEPQAYALFGTLVGILGASRYRNQKRA